MACCARACWRLIAFVALGRLNEYATGPAFVQLDGRTTLTADRRGPGDARWRSSPGDRVEAGDVLVRFFASEEVAELQAATSEFDSQLAKLLLRPDDAMTREALVVAALAARAGAASAASDACCARRTRGVVGDVRVREGQTGRARHAHDRSARRRVGGDGDGAPAGRYRPLLHAGDKLRFELDGFHQRAHELTITRVGEQIVGPERSRALPRPRSRRCLRDHRSGGAGAGDACPTLGFEIDGQRYEFASGMFGKAESGRAQRADRVRVRAEPQAVGRSRAARA